MGILAKRNLQAREELVFDYNVDRYGADPHACYPLDLRVTLNFCCAPSQSHFSPAMRSIFTQWLVMRTK